MRWKGAASLRLSGPSSFAKASQDTSGSASYAWHGQFLNGIIQEILFGKLTEDFGGHPYLIRHACSIINSLCKEDRPVRVDKAIYEKGKRLFIRDYSHYMELIMNVLKEHYNDEYEMLKYLAIGDDETFKEFAELSSLYTNHLIGYGIIEESRGNYSFRIEAIQEYLVEKQKYKKKDFIKTVF